MIPRIDPQPVGAATLEAPLRAAQIRAPASAAPGVLSATVAHGAAAEHNLALLAEPTYVVTTGQQPGLFGGPLYSLYKGLAAAALAERLATELERPVVPVYWVAGDDHDFHEANHAVVLSVENELLDLTVRVREPDAPLLPLAREPVGTGIDALLGDLAQATPDTEFKAGVLDWLAGCYPADRSLADAFTALMADLLGEYGVVVFRAHAPSVKPVAAPLIVEALRRSVHRLVPPGPVDTPPDATLVMVEGKLGRDRLVEDDGIFHARRSGERWSLEELDGLMHEAPEQLSPNVLLRPVIEAHLWPTIAYVAGPGELGYFPQAAPLYEALAVAAQPAVPRFGARIVEGRVLKVLEKYGVAAEDLAQPSGRLEARLVREDLPPQAGRALAALRAGLASGYDELIEAAVTVDPTMRKPVESAKGQALSALGHIEKRLVSHLKRQNEILVQQIDKARVNLFPRGKPQERVLAWPMYAIRYGDALREALWRAARTWAAALPLDGPVAEGSG